MNISSAGGNTGWSLTRADMLLCIVPIALFLSIVSFVWPAACPFGGSSIPLISAWKGLLDACFPVVRSRSHPLVARLRLVDGRDGRDRGRERL